MAPLAIRTITSSIIIAIIIAIIKKSHNHNFNYNVIKTLSKQALATFLNDSACVNALPTTEPRLAPETPGK